MPYVSWRDSYCIGHKIIDLQHQKLVSMINVLYRSLDHGPVNDEVGKVLKELVAYTRYHFRTEEKLMRELGYPGLVEQQKMHKALIAQLVQILQGLKDDKQVTALDLIALLSEWLTSHIVKEDAAIGRFLRLKQRRLLHPQLTQS